MSETGHFTWTVTFQPSQGDQDFVKYVCDPHDSFMIEQFLVTGGPPPPPPTISPEFAVSDAPSAQQVGPKIAFDGTNYLASWRQGSIDCPRWTGRPGWRSPRRAGIPDRSRRHTGDGVRRVELPRCLADGQRAALDQGSASQPDGDRPRSRRVHHLFRWTVRLGDPAECRVRRDELPRRATTGSSTSSATSGSGRGTSVPTVCSWKRARGSLRRPSRRPGSRSR